MNNICDFKNKDELIPMKLLQYKKLLKTNYVST